MSVLKSLISILLLLIPSQAGSSESQGSLHGGAPERNSATSLLPAFRTPDPGWREPVDALAITCPTTISPSLREADSFGSTLMNNPTHPEYYIVDAEPSCTWGPVIDSANWLQAQAGGAPVGPGTVYAFLQNNPSTYSRSATIQVGQRIVNLRQRGQEACSMPLTHATPNDYAAIWWGWQPGYAANLGFGQRIKPSSSTLLSSVDVAATAFSPVNASPEVRLDLRNGSGAILKSVTAPLGVGGWTHFSISHQLHANTDYYLTWWMPNAMAEDAQGSQIADEDTSSISCGHGLEGWSESGDLSGWDSWFGKNWDAILRINYSAALKLVALGDSYSSGHGAGSYTGESHVEGWNWCLRSELAWSMLQSSPSVPGAAASIERDLFACSGARIRDLSNARVFPPWGVGPEAEPAQLSHTAELAAADLVTITIGGNDVLFGKVLKECALSPSCESATFFPSGESSSLLSQVETQLSTLRSSLISTYIALKATIPAPSAVVVVGYPKMFPSTFHFPCTIDDNYDAGEVAWLRGLTDDLNLEVRCAAAEAGVHFVPLDDSQPRLNSTFFLEGHEMCGSGLDWFGANLVDIGAFAHPRYLGQRAIAAAVNAYLDSSGQVTLPPNPQPTTPPECLPRRPTPRAGEPGFAEGQLVVEPQGTSCGLSTSVAPGASARFLGSGFSSGAVVTVFLLDEDGSSSLGIGTASASGDLDVVLGIPNDAAPGSEAGVKAVGLSASGEYMSLYATLEIVASTSSDSDGDGYPDACDTCPGQADPQQGDSDQDGIGDACDACALDPENDFDEDGLCAGSDACPLDPLNDSDADGVCAERDTCPHFPNSGDAGTCLFGAGLESGDLSEWTSALP